MLLHQSRSQKSECFSSPHFALDINRQDGEMVPIFPWSKGLNHTLWGYGGGIHVAPELQSGGSPVIDVPTKCFLERETERATDLQTKIPRRTLKNFLSRKGEGVTEKHLKED
jgi:hypothetical protein